ncbi:MAG: hypothetical protein H7301_09685 [Cryobacterium sp.]|nr:hypothetical protein [Oligoflexia bacterium]
MKVFSYPNCDICKKALKFLVSKGATFEKVDIVENPPSISDLEQMVKYLEKSGRNFQALFNTSGFQYREFRIASQLADGLVLTT